MKWLSISIPVINILKLLFLVLCSDFYLSASGKIPEFKAGLDMGQVTVTEIGDIKREVAYHGDVLNTASRIQHKCNELNSNMLVSENLGLNVNMDDRFEKSLVGEVNLRGKHDPANIYRITYLV